MRLRFPIARSSFSRVRTLLWAAGRSRADARKAFGGRFLVISAGSLKPNATAETSWPGSLARSAYIACRLSNCTDGKVGRAELAVETSRASRTPAHFRGAGRHREHRCTDYDDGRWGMRGPDRTFDGTYSRRGPDHTRLRVVPVLMLRRHFRSER